MGGDEHGICGRHTCVCARSGWWQGVYVVVKGVAFPSFATACATYPATVRPWRRGSSDTRRRVPAQEKGTKGPALPPGLACARAGVHYGARTSGPHGHTRERERRVATHDGEKGRLSQNASARRRRQRHLQTI
jgi:hypothetical protein